MKSAFYQEVSMDIDVKTANILVIGLGCKVSSALKRLIELYRREEESFQAMKIWQMLLVCRSRNMLIS